MCVCVCINDEFCADGEERSENRVSFEKSRENRVANCKNEKTERERKSCES